MLIKLVKKILNIYVRSNNARFVQYLQRKGIAIGEDVIFVDPKSARIDITRPCLVSIGNRVSINVNFQLLTHDWCTHVFRNYFHNFLNSSGEVRIGNNVYIATNVTILKGVTIGDNCIIGAGSVVNKSIPNNSVAAGVPCRVICSLEEYYERCKKRAPIEAQEYIKCFRKRNKRNPEIEELQEEFIYFVDHRNIHQYESLFNISLRISRGYPQWLQEHKAPYDTFESFLNNIQ